MKTLTSSQCYVTPGEAAMENWSTMSVEAASRRLIQEDGIQPEKLREVFKEYKRMLCCE